jgi:hypothetical protein
MGHNFVVQEDSLNCNNSWVLELFPRHWNLFQTWFWGLVVLQSTEGFWITPRFWDTVYAVIHLRLPDHSQVSEHCSESVPKSKVECSTLGSQICFPNFGNIFHTVFQSPGLNATLITLTTSVCLTWAQGWCNMATTQLNTVTRLESTWTGILTSDTRSDNTWSPL